MKRIILIASFVLALSLSLILAACDGGNDKTTTTSATTTTTTTATTTTTSSTTSSSVNDPDIDPDIDPHTHEFGEWTVTIAPTCDADGEETRKCSCGETETRTVEATGHDFGEWTVTTAPTCDADGEETRSCSCGETETRTVEATGHDYKNDVCENCGEQRVSEGLEFTSLGGGECYVSGIGSCTDTHIIIPDVSPEGESVVAIGSEAFRGSSDIKSVKIPDSVTVIKNAAFMDCKGIENVTLPNGLKTIEGWAFDGCEGLENIDIPTTVTSIGEGAFSRCYSLKSIEIPLGVTSIEMSTFWGCVSLESVILPDGITSIGDCAFAECESLVEINIPEGVESLGESAFDRCSTLVSIELPNSLTSIDKRAFIDCTSLKHIEVPGSVLNIEYGVFSGCTSLESVIFGDGVEAIGDRVLEGCSGLNTVYIPESVKSIGWYNFYECAELTTVNYAGSKTDWAQISFSAGNDALTDDVIIYGKNDALEENRFFLAIKAVTNGGKLGLLEYTDPDTNETVRFTDGLAAYKAVYDPIIADLRATLSDIEGWIYILENVYEQDIPAIIGEETLAIIAKYEFMANCQYDAIINVLTVYESYDGRDDTKAYNSLVNQVEYIASINWNDDDFTDMNGNSVSPEDEVARCGKIDYITAQFDAAIAQ